ncbi:glycosyltransferase family 2 protein [Hirschia litorea]|uniref:Glycosyltransferase family 2 protein n=1 Tax=Hirschia litorea TaxID=1199156 RepID=A0ABW2IGA3_9PROT
MLNKVDLAKQTYAVIPTLNEEHYIETCLRSLMVGDAALSHVQFVVVDGGSDDKTVQIVERLKGEFSNLSVLHNPKKLQAAALNLAAEQAPDGAKIMVRCDAHSIYPQDFVLTVAGKLAEIEAASVVVPMDAVGTQGYQEANAWVVDKPLGSGGSSHRGGSKSGYVDHGHHAAFDLEVFRSLGGYDENFSHNEDAEYDHRVNEAGHKVYMYAEGRIEYMPRPTFRATWKQYFKYGRAMNMKKHGTKPKLRQAIPIINLGIMAASVVAWGVLAATNSLLAFPLITLMTAMPIVYLSVLVLVGLVCAVKLKKISGLNAGLALGAMHNAWALGFLKGYLFVPVEKQAIEVTV